MEYCIRIRTNIKHVRFFYLKAQLFNRGLISLTEWRKEYYSSGATETLHLCMCTHTG